jgi:hypothetical protein
MKKTSKIFLIYLLGLIFSSVVSGGGATLADLANDFFTILCNIICVIWFIIGAIAALVLIIAGSRYMASENPLERNKAKKMGVFAIIGLVIVLVSPYTANYLTGSLGILPFKCWCISEHPIPTKYKLSCSECWIGSCNCTSNCNLGFVEIYFGKCKGAPIHDTSLAGGKATWSPSRGGIFHLKVICADGGKSDCVSVNAFPLPSTTTTTTSITETTTITETTLTTTTISGTTTTTTVSCYDRCIDDNYADGFCSGNCIGYVYYGHEGCPSLLKCCCIPTSTTTTSTTITTSSTTTPFTTTTTSTTTTTISNYLTAENLVDCINSKGGRLYTESWCQYCIKQKAVFTGETIPPVGPGEPEYDRLNKVGSAGSPCGGIPCWIYGSSYWGSCKTFRQLNSLYDCNLVSYPGHSYLSC